MKHWSNNGLSNRGILALHNIVQLVLDNLEQVDPAEDEDCKLPQTIAKRQRNTSPSSNAVSVSSLFES